MDWERIEPDISLNDPESRFRFESTDAGGVRLTYRDWQNRRIILQFADVRHFCYGMLPPVADCSAGEFYRATWSPLIEHLRERGLVESDELVFHFLVSSHENEWFEIVAASHDLAFED